MAQDDTAFSAILELRKIRHAEVEAESSARRKARNAPKRDDINRAAYYILLLSAREAEATGQKDVLRPRLLRLLEDAGFDKEPSAQCVQRSAGRVVTEMKRWIRNRELDREEAAGKALLSAADKE